MDREIPNVPIIMLTAVASLSEVLPEMPLPTPLPQTLSTKSLLFHPRVAEKAQNLLGVRDDALVPELVHSLVRTFVSDIEVKDHYSRLEHSVEQQDGMPELLKAVLCRNPDVFGDNSGLSPVHASDAPAVPITYDNKMDSSNSISTSAAGPQLKSTQNSLTKKESQPMSMLQPFVKLERLSFEFADSKMNSTKSTRSGRVRDDKNVIIDEESDSETKESPKIVKKEKKKNVHEDEKYIPDIFPTLADRKNTFKDEKQEQVVVVKSKLGKVEKEFEPVLEKLSFEELMEKNTYQRFNKTADLVVKSSSDHDSTEIGSYTLLLSAADEKSPGRNAVIPTKT